MKMKILGDFNNLNELIDNFYYYYEKRNSNYDDSIIELVDNDLDNYNIKEKSIFNSLFKRFIEKCVFQKIKKY